MVEHRPAGDALHDEEVDGPGVACVAEGENARGWLAQVRQQAGAPSVTVGGGGPRHGLDPAFEGPGAPQFQDNGLTLEFQGPDLDGGVELEGSGGGAPPLGEGQTGEAGGGVDEPEAVD